MENTGEHHPKYRLLPTYNELYTRIYRLSAELTAEGKRSAILQEALEEIAEGSGTDPQQVAEETLEAIAELKQ
mgnify:CR=1 FL=1